MEKIGLVLEGGGVRGSYTAGALAWLHDQGIWFDYYVGISSGAAYLACYLTDNMSANYNMAVNYACDKENVGIRAIMKEGYYVAYKHIFTHYLLETEHLDMRVMREKNPNAEFGAYDLEEGKTIFFGAQDCDDKLDLIRGSCSLPVASAVVQFKNHQLLDGGITKMIPIERALEQGCDKCLIVTTKPEGYVRKPSSGIVKKLMRIIYRKYPQVAKDYEVRHINYYKQMDIIQNLIDEGKGIMIRPTETINVSRWKGDHDNCLKLYNLGYADMEAAREEILAFMKK